MILGLHKKLKDKEISAVELAQEYLKKAQDKNKELNSFLTICEEEALAQAKKADEMIARGEMTLLTGIPYSLKDNFCTKGIKTTAASKILENYIPPYNATAYQKLQEAGAVLIGKNNLDEFAMGCSGEFSAYGPTKNPRDLTKVPGGSSSGPAASVAAEQVVFSLGTDTAGSIRLPAAFCEVVGLKPTYGRVSRAGVIALASSLDCVGPVTQTPEDAAIVLKVLAGHDRLDSTTPKTEVPDYLTESKAGVKGLKIGVPQEYFVEGIDPKIKKEVEKDIDKLKEKGAEIKEVSLPHTELAIAVYYVLCPCEVSSNLARYDGIKFGSTEEADDLFNFYCQTRGKYLGTDVRRRIMIGTFALSAGYQDAYYRQSRKVQTLVKKDFIDVFQQVDVLVCPTTPTGPFKLGERLNDPLAMYLSDLLTVPADLAGVPALTLKNSTQIIAPQMKEGSLFRVAQSLQS